MPHHDPYLKVTDIHCLNFSRAETFQDAGCTPEIILPEQVSKVQSCKVMHKFTDTCENDLSFEFELVFDVSVSILSGLSPSL